MEKYQHVFLRSFKSSELIFDDDETKEVLKFFFIHDHELIDGLVVNDKIRGFAQGILVEAVDATYAIGFVEIVHKTFNLQPPVRMRKILAKFGRRAAVYWFKNAKATDLINVRIYNIVRTVIGSNFRKTFQAIANDLVMKRPIGVVLAYTNPLSDSIVWG